MKGNLIRWTLLPLGCLLLSSLFPACHFNNDTESNGKADSVNSFPSDDALKKTANGLSYIIHEKHEGPSPENGEVVKMDMLIQTRERDLMNTFVGDKNYFMVVKEPAFRGDIVEILPSLSEGDSVTAKTLASYLYQGRVPPQIGRYDTVYTHFKILGFFNEEEELQKYIQKKGHEVDTLEKGLYRAFFENGQGDSISEGDSVVMEFTGRLLSGKVFNTSANKSEPLAFTYGQKDLIKGLEMGVKGLKPGAHVKIFMTSEYGYGKEGARPHILPYSPLIYDIKVLKVMQTPS